MGKLSSPLKAGLFLDRRASGRHLLRLAARASVEASDGEVLIHDISEAGVGFETSLDLQIGSVVLVDLPFVGTSEGRIVWRQKSLYGCEFATPITQGAVSASLLQSTRGLVEETPNETVEEISIGIRPSLDAIAQWHIEFEQTKGAKGYRLIGFRQTSEGVTMAMITKMS